MADETRLAGGSIAFLALAAGLLVGWGILRFGFGMRGFDSLLAAVVFLNLGDAARTFLRERQRRSRPTA